MLHLQFVQPLLATHLLQQWNFHAQRVFRAGRRFFTGRHLVGGLVLQKTQQCKGESAIPKEIGVQYISRMLRTKRSKRQLLS